MINKDYILKIQEHDTPFKEHLMTVYDLVVNNNFKTIIEIGAGESSWALTAAANITDGQVYSFDVNENAWRWYPWHDIALMHQTPRFHVTVGDNVEAVKSWNQPVDFILLDTTHDYEQTRKELDIWPNWLKVGGYLVMHDTAHKTGIMVGCRHARDEFLKKTNSYELDERLNCNGLSIMKKLKRWGYEYFD